MQMLSRPTISQPVLSRRRLLSGLAGAGVLAFTPMARAESCPALPGKVIFNSGALVEVLDRRPDQLIYRQTLAENGRIVEMTVQLGIFTLTALRDGEGAVFDWKTPLPVLADLVPGATFAAEAILTTPGFLPPRPFTAEVEVLGEEELVVAGCSYPVMKVLVKNNEGGKSLGENTKWIHLPSLITLKSEIREGTDVKGQEAILIE